MADSVIAVDPGRAKCGVAVVDRYKGVQAKAVVATEQLAGTVAAYAASFSIFTVVIGDRTASRSAQAILAQLTVAGRPLTVWPVDEHRTSEQARRRYWQANPPRGWKALLPVTMLTPPGPVDDYVAVILAERYFAGRPGKK